MSRRTPHLVEEVLAAAVTPDDVADRAMCPACCTRWGWVAICPMSLCPSCRTTENLNRLPKHFGNARTIAGDIPRWERAGWDMTKARAIVAGLEATP
jgi:hypothetical protein